MYDITVSSNEGGAVSPQSGSFEEGSTVTYTATPNAEYEFTKWSNGSTQNPLMLTVTSNLTLQAIFTKKQYELIISKEGEGNVNEKIINTGKGYDSGTKVELTAVPAGEWVFAGWSGDVTSNDNPLQVTISSPKNIKVKFVKRKYPLTINIQGQGTVTEEIVNTARTTDYESGTTVKLTAEGLEGWIFSGWSGDIESTNETITINVSESMSINALFSPAQFISKSERFSIINETTGYYKNQMFFDNYFDISFFENEINIRDNSISYRVFGKDMVVGDLNENGLQDFFGWATYFGSEGYASEYGKFIYIPDFKYQKEKTIIPSIINFGAGKMEINDFDNDGKNEVLFWTTNTKLNSYNYEENIGGNVNNPTLKPQLIDFDHPEVSISGLGIKMDSHCGASGDVDNDGDIDFLQFPMYSEDKDYVSPRFPITNLNDGGGNFIQVNTMDNTFMNNFYDWAATALELFDLNGDDNLDIIAGWNIGNYQPQCQGCGYSDTIKSPVVLWGNGTGTYSLNNSTVLPETTYNNMGIRGTILGFAFTDFDLDGDIDVFVSTTRTEINGSFSDGTYYDNYYSLFYRNEGNKNFIEYPEAIVGSYDQTLTKFTNFYLPKSIDKDNDGSIDIVPDGVASWGSFEYISNLYWKKTGGKLVRKEED